MRFEKQVISNDLREFMKTVRTHAICRNNLCGMDCQNVGCTTMDNTGERETEILHCLKCNDSCKQEARNHRQGKLEPDPKCRSMAKRTCPVSAMASRG
mmetsp:Transcript_135230/g.432300  ORF Transcript_135230/g.432300 Transcript_135230/m.432300 type:complete len:98 (-) Transcript_135230:297-590(-)